eukprot:scaffold32889_cov36-Tisochrysis_lutea.AAC.1
MPRCTCRMSKATASKSSAPSASQPSSNLALLSNSLHCALAVSPPDLLPGANNQAGDDSGQRGCTGQRWPVPHHPLANAQSGRRRPGGARLASPPQGVVQAPLGCRVQKRVDPKKPAGTGTRKGRQRPDCCIAERYDALPVCSMADLLRSSSREEAPGSTDPNGCHTTSMT